MIDTGATASFLPRQGHILPTIKTPLKAQKSDTRTADNALLDCTHQISAKVAVWANKIVESEIRFRVMNNASHILGYDGLLGTDAIKALQIHVVPAKNTLVAKINDCVIGEERVDANRRRCAAASAVQIESPLDELLSIYADVFADQAISVMKTPPMRIPLIRMGAPKARLRRSSEEDIEEIRKQVNSMLDRSIIEPSISPFSANCHLVPKKSGQKRLVINYIPLNKIAEKDHYPLPQIADLLVHLSKAKFYCALDCTEGFWQIAIAPEERHKTAFITPHGQYQFTRCPFGFTNSPAIYQRAMNTIFKEGLYRRCVIYVDDILIYGSTKEETLCNLEWVLRKCRENCVKLKRSKCEFMRTKVSFLGFEVQSGHIAPALSKAEDWLKARPRDKNQVLAILGSLNYYSRFLADYSEKTYPLRQAIKNVPFNWTKECQDAVITLVNELREAEPQVLPDCNSPKVVEIAALEHSIEACCLTDDDKLIMRTSSLYSETEKRYTTPEKELLALVRAYDKFGPFLKGSTTVRSSCLALSPIMRLKEKPERVTRLLLKLPPDALFQLETNNALPDALHRSENPIDEVFYTDGACKDNGKEDCTASWAVVALYRPDLKASGLLVAERPSSQKAELEAARQACLIAKRECFRSIAIVSDSKYVVNSCSDWTHKWQSNGWKDNRGKEIQNKEELQQLLKAREGLNIQFVHVKGHQGDRYNEQADRLARLELEKLYSTCAVISEPPTWDQGSDEAIRTIMDKIESNDTVPGYVIENNLLWKTKNGIRQLVIPISQRLLLLKLAHDDPIYGAHLGVKKTKRKLENFYWSGKDRDIDRYIRSCDICQHHKAKKGKPYGKLRAIKTSALFERVHMDIIGPINCKPLGNRYIITAIDAFSRYAKAEVRKDVTTHDTLNFLKSIIQEHGPPDHLVTDNGPQFKSSIFTEYLELIGTKHHTTCEYHPQANGMDERFNATLLKLIRNLTKHGGTNLDRLTPWCVLAYNLTPHEATRMSPYTVMFGRLPRTPLEVADRETLPDSLEHDNIRQVASEHVDKSRTDMIRQYDKNRKDLTLQPLDMVMIKTRRVPRSESKKLYPKWTGPCCVLKLITHDDKPMAVEVLDSEDFRARRVPFCDIKPYYTKDNLEKIDLPGEKLVEHVLEITPVGVPPDFSPLQFLNLSSETHQQNSSQSTLSIPGIESLPSTSGRSDGSGKPAAASGDAIDRIQSPQLQDQIEPPSAPSLTTESGPIVESDRPGLQTDPSNDSRLILPEDVIREVDISWIKSIPTDPSKTTGRGGDSTPEQEGGCKSPHEMTEAAATAPSDLSAPEPSIRPVSGSSVGVSPEGSGLGCDKPLWWQAGCGDQVRCKSPLMAGELDGVDHVTAPINTSPSRARELLREQPLTLHPPAEEGSELNPYKECPSLSPIPTNPTGTNRTSTPKRRKSSRYRRQTTRYSP